MSRAMRRHPAVQQKAKRQPKAPPIRTGGRRQQQESRRGGGFRVQWASDIVGELRKVTWPSREDTYYLTFVVLVVTMAFAVFLGGIDMFFNWAIDRVILP